MSFNTPSGVQVSSSTNWLASNAVYDMREPQNDRVEAKVWGTQDLTGLMDMLGGKNAVGQIQFRHFEEDRIHEVIIAAYTSGSTGSANDTITYTVDATDYMAGYPANVVTPFVSTGTQVNLMPVRVDEILIFPNGAQGVVTTVTPSSATFTVVSTNGVAQGSALTNADTIINLGVSQGEGKTMPTSFNYREGVYTNVIETMTDSHESTGRAMGEKTWVTYDWKGQSKSSWWFKGQSTTYKRFRNFRELKYVAGEYVVSATGINAYDATLTRTEGLVPFSTSYNAVNTFNTNAGLTLDDWQTIYSDQLDKNGGTTEYAVWTSITNRKAIESFVRAEMKEGGVQYGAFSGGKDQAVNFGFGSFMTLGYTSHLFTYKPFNDPTTLGAAGHVYTNLSLFIPMNKEIFAIGDKKEKTEVPSMRINYMNENGYNREWEEFLTGGANGVYTDRTDKVQINFRSDSGIELFGANRFAAMKGVTS